MTDIQFYAKEFCKLFTIGEFSEKNLYIIIQHLKKTDYIAYKTLMSLISKLMTRQKEEVKTQIYIFIKNYFKV